MTVCTKGALYLGPNEDKAKELETLAKSKNLQTKIYRIVTNEDNMNNISNSLFKNKLPSDAWNDPITYRNRHILAWQEYHDMICSRTENVSHNITWNSYAKKHNINMTLNEFNTAFFSYMEYLQPLKENLIGTA